MHLVSSMDYYSSGLYSLACIILGPAAFRIQMNKAYKHGSLSDTFTNTGAIDPAGVTFDTKPIVARILPSPLYPPYFILAASGYDGMLTLSAGVYALQRELAERFLDAMVAELVAVAGTLH